MARGIKCHYSRRFANGDHPLCSVPKKEFLVFTIKELARMYHTPKTTVNYIKHKRGIVGAVGRCYLCAEPFLRKNNAQRACPDCFDELHIYKRMMDQCNAYEQRVRRQLFKTMKVWTSKKHSQEELRGLVPSLNG